MASSDRGIQIKVGMLIVGAAALLAGFLIVLGNVSFADGYMLFVDYDFSGNIQAGAPVKVSGIKVGKVKQVEFMGGEMDPKVKRHVQVRLHVWVENRVKEAVRADAEFFVNTAGVLGEQYLEIAPGTRDKPALAPGAIVRGVDPPRTDLIVARLYEFLDSVTVLLRNDKDLIRDFLKSGTSVVRSLDKILSGNEKEIGKLITDLDKFTTETTLLVGSLRTGVGDAKQIQQTLTNVEKLTATINAEIDPLLKRARRALDGVANVTDIVREGDKDKLRDGIDNLVKVSAKVNGMTADLQKIVTDVKSGRGTAGALLVDEEIYDDLKEMLRDLKRNPWKFFWKE
jgi:phospholipid/cholesterol/gamma-HCH transport system substrate-binding protein